MTADDKIYAAYLNAYAAVRSGWPIRDRPASAAVLAARALGASDGSNMEYNPAPRWLLLEEVNRLLHSECKKEEPCKVVSMKDVT